MFVCSDCGHGSSTRLGKCPACGAFGTFKAVGGTAKKQGGQSLQAPETIKSSQKRLFSMPELQRVFPQGITQAGTYLVAGEPGIGKSTIILQLIDDLLKKNNKLRIAYVTGEESESQVLERYNRVVGKMGDTISLYQSNDCDDIAETIQEESFDILIIDSIQTIATNRSDSTPGSPGQVRLCCDILNRATKKTNTTLIIIGHITKGGEIAGPKYLEHIVDVVIYLEGEQYGNFRFFRFRKNRFGSTDEVGIFEMHGNGLQPVYNLKERVMEQNHDSQGSVLTVGIDNGRPVLIQLEVLLNKMSGKYPQRIAQGIETARLTLIIAILEKYLGLKLQFIDVFVNIPGEFTFRDSGLDMAIAAAIYMHYKNIDTNNGLVFIGELGLGGQLIKTKYHHKRTQEASGFSVIDFSRIKTVQQLPTIF